MEKPSQAGSTHYREYCAWRAMRARCYNPKEPEFARYGARGISVCDRWKNDFSAFFEDMGFRPSPRHSLDRIDNSGNYTPENCRWTDRHTQARNTRDNRLIEYRGEKMTLVEAAERYGLTYAALWARLDVHKWPLDRALTEPMKPDKRRPADFVPGCTKRYRSSSHSRAVPLDPSPAAPT